MHTDNLDIQREIITPEIATKYLNLRFNDQRHLRPKVVEQYALHMERGTWDGNTLIRFCVVDNEEYLLDGQHRLNAVVKSGTTQTFLVQRLGLPDMAAVARMYTTIDKGLSRSIRDDLRAMGMAEALGLTPSQTNSLASAMPMLATRFRRTEQKHLHPDDRLTMMNEYLPAFVKFIQSTAGTDRLMRNRLDRSSTLAVALVTFRYSAKKYPTVESFWNGVAFDDGLSRDDPRKYCNRLLLQTGITGGEAKSGQGNRVMTSVLAARYVAGYFNAWIENRSLQQSIRVLDTSKPIVILGSPFDGKT